MTPKPAQDKAAGRKFDENGRYICTKDKPWSAEKSVRAVHPDAVSLGQDDDFHLGQSYERSHCPNCNLDFEEELPQ